MVKKKEDRTIELRSGRKVKIKPVPPLLSDSIAAKVDMPKPPIYNDVKTVWGGTETWEDLDDPQYKQDLAEARAKRQNMYWDSLFLLGIDEDAPPAEEWAGPLQYLGLDIPDDEFGLKLFWVKNVLLETQEDFFAMGAAIRALSSVSEEDIEAVASSFRSALQRVPAKSTG